MRSVTYEEGRELEKHYVCAKCGAPLTTAWGGAYGIENFVSRCGIDPNHEGEVHIKSYTQAYRDGEPIPIEIANQIERKERIIMEEEFGKDQATALEPYRATTSLTEVQAMRVLQTIWPDAPPVDLQKAAITCHLYGLNPLMKHIFLLPFKNDRTGETTWTQVKGIQATRLMASRRCSFSYIDGPRVMSKEEEESIFGEVDSSQIRAITVLKKGDGSIARGYGSWPRNREPYGTDKGNSKANMAFIRSERQAFDRLLPGEMLPELDVVDADYIEVPQPKVIVESPSVVNIQKDESPQIQQEPTSQTDNTLTWLKRCPTHDIPWFEDRYGNLVHKVSEDEWCRAANVFGRKFGEQCNRFGWTKEANTFEINEWLKQEYGNTWSKMMPQQQLQSIEAMKVKADAKEQKQE